MSLIRTKKVEGRQRNRPLKDYSGVRFGRLTASSLVARDTGSGGKNVWRFLCDCGACVDLNIRDVRSGHTSSCGCLARDTIVARNLTHGLSASYPVEYRAWKGIRRRCRAKTCGDYADYGGRGISVCGEWDDFAVFLADMGPRPTWAHSVDRVDVNGDYRSDNCRWALPQVQANNKRTNHLIEMRGETKTLAQWCEIFGLDGSKVRYRLKSGRSVEDAFSQNDFRSDSNHSNTTCVPALAQRGKV